MVVESGHPVEEEKVKKPNHNHHHGGLKNNFVGINSKVAEGVEHQLEEIVIEEVF